MVKLQLFEYEAVHNSVISAVKLFQDPADPGSPIYQGNVVKSLPGVDKFGSFMPVLGHVSLDDIPSVISGGSGDEVAIIRGQLFTWLIGRDDQAVEKCERYCDISRAYFKNGDLLSLRDSYIQPSDNTPNQFTKINLSENPRKPLYYTLGSTGFVIEKDLDPTVYTL